MQHISFVSPEHGEIQFQQNPQEIETSIASGWQGQTIAGVDDQLLSFGGGGGLTKTLTVKFFGARGRKTAELLEKTARRQPWRGAQAPPVWNLVIGNRVLPVIVDGLTKRESYFNHKLEPELIEFDLTLRKYVRFGIKAQ